LRRDLVVGAGIDDSHGEDLAPPRVYSHRTKGQDRDAAEQIATLFFGPDWKVPEDNASDST